MKNLLVLKFGGTSLMTADRITQAAQIVANEAAMGSRLVVVVSAMGHTTDALIDLASGITSVPGARELDALLATGEQVAATLMTMALQKLGLKARSFSGIQARIVTDREYGNATIKHLSPRALQIYLDEGYIPVVTGFQGVTNAGDVTTLGRGGSDTTAIAIAAAMKAERCDIYTDVDGIYSADPRMVKEAVRLESVSLFEMLELARNGAKVLNARSVEIAIEKHVPLRVLSTFDASNEGTFLSNHAVSSEQCFTGVSLNKDIDLIEFNLGKLELGPDRHLKALRRARTETKTTLLRHLAGAGIRAEIVAARKLNPFKILVKVQKADSLTAVATLHKSELSPRDISVNAELVSLVVVASKISIKHEIDALDVLSKNAIQTLAFSIGLTSMTFLIPAADAESGLRALHNHFCRKLESRSDECYTGTLMVDPIKYAAG